MSQDEDSDSGPNLEAAVMQTGTEWADATEETPEVMQVNSDQQNQPDNQVKWSMVVMRRASQVAAACPAPLVPNQNVDNRANNFVIPNKVGPKQVKMCTQHSVRSGTQGRGGQFDFSGPELQYKSVVELVFLAYNRVSVEGPRPSLMQIVTAVVETLDDAQAVDAVQPMRSGWWIYLQTAFDREQLVSSGITLGGKHIPLRFEFRPQCQTSVKDHYQRPAAPYS